MNTREILDRFSGLSALVIGDICLDRWCSYDPDAAEPSRETGLARVGVVATEITAGAGGTVANNLSELGTGRVSVLGVAGCDGFGFELKQALARRGIEADLLVEVEGMQTFTYTKLLNAATGEEDLGRIDFITAAPLAADVEQRVLERIHEAVPSFDVIMVSDQAETSAGGVVTGAVRELIAELARFYPSKLFWVDSRMRAELFRDVIVKPNEREAREACERLLGRVDHAALQRTIGSKPLIVTHGGDGAEIIAGGKTTWVAGRMIENPVDICGAGDSFSAGAAMTMAITGSAVEAARIGNLVASITIMKKGTGTAAPSEVLAADR